MSLLSLNVTSRSAAETQEVAARLLPGLAHGDLILLGGELGAGKTTFTQGLARAMGITEAVTSPTFTLMRTYEAPGPAGPAGPASPAGSQQGRRLLHADLYRLDLQEVVDLGLAEWFDDGTIAVVEWGDTAARALAAEYLEVRIDFGPGDDDRTVSLAGVGPRWAARLPRLGELLNAEGR